MPPIRIRHEPKLVDVGCTGIKVCRACGKAWPCPASAVEQEATAEVADPNLMWVLRKLADEFGTMGVAQAALAALNSYLSGNGQATYFLDYGKPSPPKPEMPTVRIGDKVYRTKELHYTSGEGNYIVLDGEVDGTD